MSDFDSPLPKTLGGQIKILVVYKNDIPNLNLDIFHIFLFFLIVYFRI